MDFKFVGVFNRGITIEMINDFIYEVDDSLKVYVNDELVLETKHNVFSIFDLKPTTNYVVKVEYKDEVSTHDVTTSEESYLLNVKDFGAYGDGVKNDTNAIQAAIMACPENGTVYLPKGTYFVTPLFMKSNITFYLSKDAILLADTNRNNYPVLKGMLRHNDEVNEHSLSSWEGNPLSSFASLITAIDCKNVNIIGEGTLNGNADKSDWWLNHRTKRIAWRPNIVFFNNCEYMNVAGLKIMNSPCWTVHPYYSDHLNFFNLFIKNPYNSPNTDGFDPESCTDILLLGTKISVGDDCVAIKSGKIYMAKNHFKRTDNVEIRNCHFERGHGSVTIGSEIAGGVTNVRINQCLFEETDRGVRVKTRRGRGEKSLLDNISFNNVLMNKVHMPMTFNMFYFCDPDGHSDYVQNQEYKPVTDMTPEIGHIIVKNTTCVGVDSAFLTAYGLPEKPIKKIELENVTASFLPEEDITPNTPIMMDNFAPLYGKTMWLGNVEEVSLNNVTINGAVDKEVTVNNVTNYNTNNLHIN